jgi:hypothetical protein
MKKMDYEVGYGKPPKKTQWEKGQSGNPSGKKGGAGSPKPLLDCLVEALNDKIEITVNGKKQTITKGRAVAISLLNGALGGSIKEKLFFLEKLQKLGVLNLQALKTEDQDDIPELTDEDRRLLEFSRKLLSEEDGE